MSDKHLSDADIQQFVLEKANCSLGILAHMHQCNVCKKKADTYKVLFAEIKQVAKPVFDFDLSAAVLRQIEPEKPKFSLNSLPGYSTIFSILAAIAILASLYRTTINLFIRKYILEVVSGISTMIIYLIIATFLVLIIFQCIVMYKKYLRKIEDLNFY